MVAEGEALLAPSVTRRLIAEFADRPGRAGRVEMGAAGRSMPFAVDLSRLTESASGALAEPGCPTRRSPSGWW